GRRDQQGSAKGNRGGAFSRRLVLSAERGGNPNPGARIPSRRHPSPGGSLLAPLCRKEWQASEGLFARRSARSGKLRLAGQCPRARARGGTRGGLEPRRGD